MGSYFIWVVVGLIFLERNRYLFYLLILHKYLPNICIWLPTSTYTNLGNNIILCLLLVFEDVSRSSSEDESMSNSKNQNQNCFGAAVQMKRMQKMLERLDPWVRVFKTRYDNLGRWNDKELFMRFRLYKGTVANLLQRIISILLRLVYFKLATNNML